ncbi:hypothetical protein PIB30_076713 [Stylosanthes scabra]|uniref:Uncharacterized protein n=1 Tax=Stylosanthes scabra TaxID=79078 RepID=A0ABU6SS86_9FABA|nr:hypothetical protein [Stylosanthes scabra]
MSFVYVLNGWEGSASDSRVLRDAITRRNCLQVPNGRFLKHGSRLIRRNFTHQASHFQCSKGLAGSSARIEQQVQRPSVLGKEPDEEDPTMDDYFMSSEPTATGPADTQGNPGQGTASSVDRTASTRKLSGKKRKHAYILERIADEVHESTAAQREHV